MNAEQKQKGGVTPQRLEDCFVGSCLRLPFAKEERGQLKFYPTGPLLVTQAATPVVPPPDLVCTLRRYLQGDWGDVSTEDVRLNDLALREGGRLIAKYYTRAGNPFLVVTEADHSLTTVMLPEEY